MTYDMDTMIEASSLSSITQIASNPPQHPSVPIQTLGHPLVLYIARVPGSRDVFLTPMKPREKVVTAEDVQSSLYYVHINCEEDHGILQARTPSSANADTSELFAANASGVKRRPALPARPQSPVSPPYPVNDTMPGAIRRTPSPSKPQHIARKPVMTDISNERPPLVPPHLDLPDIPRRPLPTPPDEQPHRTSLRKENVRLLRRSDHSEENNPYFRKYESEPALEADAPEFIPGSLTLIRRDPASSQQWNVASIHDPPVQEVSSSTLLKSSSARRTKRGGAPLYLDITNSGYSQFIDKDRPDSRISSSTHSSDSEPPPEGTFRRRLYMPGSRYGEHSYGHRKLNSVDSSSSGDMRKSMRDRTLSDLTGGSSPMLDKRSKGYSFTSPWDGKCEFATGATGKSLKCRHTFAQQGTAEVSELRFNLPTSSRNTPTSNSEKRSSYFSRHSRQLSGEDGSSTPSIVIDDDGRVDLTLGQERAGGGFGGKQAKLGKLVIEPEGLQMLDLLVAANIGLWWRAYERV